MRRIGLLVFPGFEVLDLAALCALELANCGAGQPVYEIALYSEAGGLVASSSGVSVATRGFDSPEFDTIIAASALTAPVPTPGLAEFVRAASAASRRTASICTGAFVLAGAGLLDGRRATTHWRHTADLQARFPAVRVDATRLFIADAGIWTSAGMSAGIDMMLALIEEDLGAALSRTVAGWMVLNGRRAGGQSQETILLDVSPGSDRMQAVLAHIRGNLDQPLTIERLAEVACLSPRHFSRAFHAETGQSPARVVERLRVEAAQALIREGAIPLGVVARQTGFGTALRMRRAFQRSFGTPPKAQRPRPD